jgi:hypothetical protein
VMLGKPENVNDALITSVNAYPNFDALFEDLKQQGKEEEHETRHARSVRGR